MPRIILHCDMNNYFATVEEKHNNSLRKVPFAVCGDPEMRHSIVMAKNSLAKKAGVPTGISYFQAKKICPDLGYVTADYRKYLVETKQAREIYLKYTDTIIPYGMDEAWIDLTETGASMKDAQQIADIIRYEIMYSMELSASVGVGDNYIFSKIGSDYKKPNCTTVISKENYKQIVWPLSASELLFVGVQTKRKLAAGGIKTIGDIAQSDVDTLVRMLGKVGRNLWQFSHGDDSGFNPENDTIKSVGNTITPPADLKDTKEAGAIIYLLVNSICTRLKRHHIKGRCVSVCMKDNQFNTMIRQTSKNLPTDNLNCIFNMAYNLFIQHYTWENPLRSIGVRVDNLHNQEYEQIALFDGDDFKIDIDINEQVKELTTKFGNLNVEKTATTKEW